MCVARITTESPHAGTPEGDQVAELPQFPLPVEVLVTGNACKQTKRRITTAKSREKQLQNKPGNLPVNSERSQYFKTLLMFSAPRWAEKSLSRIRRERKNFGR